MQSLDRCAWVPGHLFYVLQNQVYTHVLIESPVKCMFHRIESLPLEMIKTVSVTVTHCFHKERAQKMVKVWIFIASFCGSFRSSTFLQRKSFPYKMRAIFCIKSHRQELIQHRDLNQGDNGMHITRLTFICKIWGKWNFVNKFFFVSIYWFDS